MNNLRININRERFYETHTLGNIAIKNKEICYCLEPYDSGLTSGASIQLIHDTKKELQKQNIYMAIVKGLYQIQFKISPTYSNLKKYKSAQFNTLKNLYTEKGLLLPYIINPSHTDTLFHAGNYVKDTRGCILPGKSFSENSVWSSADALFELLFELDNAVSKNIKVECEIS